jgi:hypothetical protein
VLSITSRTLVHLTLSIFSHLQNMD